MATLVQGFGVALHEIPKHLAIFKRYADEHLPFGFIGDDEGKPVRIIGKSYFPHFERPSQRVQGHPHIALPCIRALFHNVIDVAALDRHIAHWRVHCQRLDRGRNEAQILSYGFNRILMRSRIRHFLHRLGAKVTFKGTQIGQIAIYPSRLSFLF